MTSLAPHAQAALKIDPSRQAIEYDGRWYDWGFVQKIADETRKALLRSGIGPDDVVSFVPRNRPSALAALAGLLADGRSVRMIYAFQSPAAIASAIERLDSGAAILAEEDFSSEVTAVLRAKNMAGIGLSEMQARLIDGFEMGAARPNPYAHPQVEILTSGTTGPPKQFPIAHDVIAQFVMGQGMSLLDDPQEPPFLFSFPIGNISGIYSTAASLLRGKRVTLLDRFSVEKWREFVIKYRPAMGGAPPAAISMILDANVPVDDLRSFKFFSTGAAPLDPVVQQEFEARYSIPILLSYGATEFGGPVVAMTPQLYEQYGATKFGSVGRAMAGVQLRVRDSETDAILGSNEEGLLEVVSPRLGPHWIKTSDIVRIDEDGFLFCLGRADGAIMRGGFKILPEAIERALLLHPAVSAAAVVGLPDPRLSQVPAAAIVLKQDAHDVDISTLEAHLRISLPSTHIPLHWRFVDALPKNPSFKIDRPALKRLFE